MEAVYETDGIWGIVRQHCHTFVVMLLTMQHKNVRKEELEQSLTEAMETTLQMVQADADRDYTSEDMRTLLIRNLVPQMNSDSELTVRMIAADAEKGLLSVEVEEHFLIRVGNGQYKVLPYNSYR